MIDTSVTTDDLDSANDPSKITSVFVKASRTRVSSAHYQEIQIEVEIACDCSDGGGITIAAPVITSRTPEMLGRDATTATAILFD